ncbi:unnamed protein product [Durusdinium trenchii]|uniref:non-specific serine/threonine protein kinase n=1 Tax=Durusdinium trenchii TaxID=1381693 RepID=A0ABP0KDW4_9DINO
MVPEKILAAHGYRSLRFLGRGQYGTAHLAESGDTPGRDQVVAKVVFLDHLKDKDRALALQEVEVLKRLFLFVKRDSLPAGHGQALVNVMEYCAGGDLRIWLDSLAQASERLPEDSVLHLFSQMLKGVEYVHSCHILHRDLKTSNMLLDVDHRIVKVGDFGIARVLESTTAVAVTMLGTPYYMSPEVCKGEPYRDKSDMWSLGCVLYEMCRFRHAFESQSLLGLVYCIVSEHYEAIPEMYSEELAKLVAMLLAKSADERPSAREALALPVLQPYNSDPAPRPFASTAPALKLSEAPPPPPEAVRRPPLEVALCRADLPELGTKPLPPKRGMPRPPPPVGGLSASNWRSNKIVETEQAGPMSSSRARTAVEMNEDVQVVLARARGALLRRPRAKGNWVQAFARHDTTGLGELSVEQFAFFLQSLSVGLSLHEVDAIVTCLLGDRSTISLFVFGEAIEHASPRYEFEMWQLANQLTGASPNGLLGFLGCSLAQAMATLPAAEVEKSQRLLLWLPKLSDGNIDWNAAEEWRSSFKSAR